MHGVDDHPQALAMLGVEGGEIAPQQPPQRQLSTDVAQAKDVEEADAIVITFPGVPPSETWDADLANRGPCSGDKGSTDYPDGILETSLQSLDQIPLEHVRCVVWSPIGQQVKGCLVRGPRYNTTD